MTTTLIEVCSCSTLTEPGHKPVKVYCVMHALNQILDALRVIAAKLEKE